MKRYQYNYLKLIDMEGIDKSDHPDYTDAFVTEAEYLGKAMTDEQLDELNEDNELVHLLVWDYLE
tara:strand:+ start:1082 stop:1276 length:195 start_codon:yes stop_codon:yes gene_type:complete